MLKTQEKKWWSSPTLGIGLQIRHLKTAVAIWWVSRKLELKEFLIWVSRNELGKLKSTAQLLQLFGILTRFISGQIGTGKWFFEHSGQQLWQWTRWKGQPTSSKIIIILFQRGTFSGDCEEQILYFNWVANGTIRYLRLDGLYNIVVWTSWVCKVIWPKDIKIICSNQVDIIGWP